MVATGDMQPYTSMTHAAAETALESKSAPRLTACVASTFASAAKLRAAESVQPMTRYSQTGAGVAAAARVRERLPDLRPGNARFDGLYQIPTFEEIVTLVRAKQTETGRPIGIYPELKHPTWLLQEAGIDTVDLLATAHLVENKEQRRKRQKKAIRQCREADVRSQCFGALKPFELER